MCIVLLVWGSACTLSAAQAGEWVWVSGSPHTGPTQAGPEPGPPGVFGTLGAPGKGNHPGARQNASAWTDKNGNLWLFGGGDENDEIRLNDLWMFDQATREWTWFWGSSDPGCKGCDLPVVYGTLGTPDPANSPGVRNSSASWTDADGNFWLYGGANRHDDLWEFNPATREWTWMGGNSSVIPLGSCGTLGVADATNNPGFREFSAAWTDHAGNFWLFGGWGFVASGSSGSPSGDLNDLWMFDPSSGEWTMMSGACSTINEHGERGIPGAYGRMRDFDERNSPGSRENATAWTDHEGNLWLFGGHGSDANNTKGDLNDLWEFDISKGEWAWMSGSEFASDPALPSAQVAGQYGKLGKPATTNTPGARHSAAAWADNDGNLWLFGGSGVDAKGNEGNLNDLWRFNPTTLEWTWMDGSNAFVTRVVSGELCAGSKGNYGIASLPSSVPSTPGGRYGASTWVDRSGNFWLFGGLGLDADCRRGYLNDLWEYRFLPQAETPTFNIKEGTYYRAQYVAISDATPDSVIYYTLDGTEPTAKSVLYTAGFTLSRTTTVKAVALAAGYGSSEIRFATFVIGTKSASYPKN